ncbi:MAG: acyltransferase [Candidatus Marsarchaeota archaeon]|nr:acyltransferase [Candidatus Marsarchaeota archaeon]
MRRLKFYPKPPGDANALVHWWRIYSPVRVAFNYAIVHLASICPSMRLKNALYRLVGVKVGRDVRIAPGAIIDFFSPEQIEIGDGAIVGFQALVMAHEFLPHGHSVGRTTIGRRALIGARAVVLAGVSVGEGAQVGAMALVNKDVPAHCLVGGVPAKTIKKLGR